MDPATKIGIFLGLVAGVATGLGLFQFGRLGCGTAILLMFASVGLLVFSIWIGGLIALGVGIVSMVVAATSPPDCKINPNPCKQRCATNKPRDTPLLNWRGG